MDAPETTSKQVPPNSYIEVVADLVSAYVSNNSMRASDLPDFIASVHASIQSLAVGQIETPPAPPPVPAVPIKKSLTQDHIICLEDGKKFKSLRRHLSSCYNMTPNEYRAKWGLPSDYPMVAPAYSATRSQLARDSGLGQISRGADAAAAAAVEGGTEASTAASEAAEAEPSEGAPSAKAGAAKPRAAKPDVARSGTAGQDVGEGEGTEPVTAAAEPEVAKDEPAEMPKKAKRGRPRKAAA